MKKFTIAILVILLALVACNSSNTTPKVEQPNVETVVAATLQAVTENAPTLQPSGIPVSYQNISFVIPQGLADGATGAN